MQACAARVGKIEVFDDRFQSYTASRDDLVSRLQSSEHRRGLPASDCRSSSPSSGIVFGWAQIK